MYDHAGPRKTMIGKTLNHYRIVNRLGKGGMGEVYLAEDTRLRRQVALKTLPAELAGDPVRVERLQREAEALAALDHPNIVPVYSLEEAEGICFLTMGLAPGRSLGEAIPAAGMELDQFFDIALPLTEALSAAHDKGIVHRDLKPDNVMVGDDGRVRVLDFGLSKLGESQRPAGNETATRAITAEGVVMGTIPYMSPEQVEGRALDHRTDLFSLGVMLYEMLTGRRPFDAGSSAALVSSILRDAPPRVSEVRHRLPRHLARIVRKCLEKDPERRYQTAKDLRNDLLGLREELASGELELPEAARQHAAAAPGRSWFWPAAVATLAVVAVASVLFTRDAPPPESSGPVPTMEIVRITSAGNASEVAISPDGNYVAYEIRSAGLEGLRVTHVSTGSHVDVVAPADVDLWDPIFAPAGDFIYYVRIAPDEPFPSLYRVPVLGGVSRRVLEHVNERISFSPDGNRFVFARFENRSSTAAAEARATEGTLLIANVDGSDERVVATRSYPDFFGDPVWSPDGSVLAVNALSFSGGRRATVVTLPADGGAERDILPGRWFDVGEGSWLPDGSGLVVTASATPAMFSSQIWEVSYPPGRTRRITNDLNSYSAAVVNGDGTVLATEIWEPAFDLWVVAPDRDASPQPLLSGRPYEGGRLTWTEEGRVVYVSNAAGNLDVWSVPAGGGEPLKLTAGPHNNYAPAASRDGRQIVFVSDREGTVNIWRMAGDGSGTTRLTDGALEEQPDISPDGAWVVYVGGPAATLFKMPTAGGDPVELHAVRSSNPRISPEGARVAVHAFHEDTGEWTLDVLSLETGELLYTVGVPISTRGITGELSPIDWSSDGKSVVYVEQVGGTGNLWVQPIDGSPPHQLTHFDSDTIDSFSWAPGGTELVISRGRFTSDIVLLRNFR
jgi:Tol biopolymer transport system component